MLLLICKIVAVGWKHKFSYKPHQSMLGLWNSENVDVPLKRQEMKVLSHLYSHFQPSKTLFLLLFFYTVTHSPCSQPPDLLFYYILVGKHLLWLSECCFHLQFYFVLQNHSGILLDPKAIVWKHFSKACRKKDIYSSVIRFLYNFSCSLLAFADDR